MKIFKFILLISILIANISASERIMITKTSKKSNLALINAKLKKVNVKMYVKKIDSTYFIYSGQYKNNNSANKALKYIRKTFPSAYVILKNENTKEPQKVDNSNVTLIKEDNSKEVLEEDDSSFFLSLALGSATIDNSLDENSVITEPENSSISYTLEGGYILNENIFFSVAYINSSTSDIDINNLYLSASYKINPTNDLGVYAGILGGYSALTLNGYEDSTASSSMLYGVQLGLSYDVYEDLAIFTTYQGLSMNHVITDENSLGIEFSLIHNLQLGILYRF